jgi:hypothetical protein
MIQRRYAKFPHLILAFVWHLDDRERAVTYAMSYSETVTLADELGWLKTASWEGGRYATTRPSARIVEMLERYRMTPGKWRRLILGPAAISTRAGL